MEEDLLRKLGLNKYEIEAYLALLNSSPITAYKLGEKSGVPSGRIYDIAEKLTLKGLAALEPGKPKKYRAIEPEKALKSLLNKKDRKWKSTKEKIEKLIPKLKRKEIKEDPISIVKERQIYYQKLKEAYHKANKEVFSIAQGLSGEKKGVELTEHLKEGIEKGIKAKVVTPITDENKGVAKKIEKIGAEVRDYPIKGVRLIIIDEKIAHFGISDETFPYDRVTISISSSELGKGLRQWYRVLWEKAEPVDL